MRSKTAYLSEKSQAVIVNLWERHYNSKVSPKSKVGKPVLSAKKYLKFDNFLYLDKDFVIFKVLLLIN